MLSTRFCEVKSNCQFSVLKYMYFFPMGLLRSKVMAILVCLYTFTYYAQGLMKLKVMVEAVCSNTHNFFCTWFGEVKM